MMMVQVELRFPVKDREDKDKYEASLNRFETEVRKLVSTEAKYLTMRYELESFQEDYT